MKQTAHLSPEKTVVSREIKRLNGSTTYEVETVTGKMLYNGPHKAIAERVKRAYLRWLGAEAKPALRKRRNRR